MDNVTHTLFALTLARTRLGRSGRGATAALVLASNAPDIDIVATLGGTANYLAWHRGPTHGPLGIAGLGALTAAIVWAWIRFRERNGGERSAVAPPATFGRLLMLSVLGVSAHILMDLPTSYGTRLLSPFDWRWFAVDWMPIVDIYLLTALGAGLVFGALSADARRRNVAIALGLMVGIYGVRSRPGSSAPRCRGPVIRSFPPRRFSCRGRSGRCR
jgi:inner membrane protein